MSQLQFSFIFLKLFVWCVFIWFFSNLGEMSMSNFLELLFAVEKRNDNQLLKKNNFLVKEWFFIDNESSIDIFREYKI